MLPVTLRLCFRVFYGQIGLASAYFCSDSHKNDDSDLTSYAGDVFYLNWDEVLLGATAVVSTIGGFGSEEQMQRINGEANVVAVKAAKDYGMWPQTSIAINLPDR